MKLYYSPGACSLAPHIALEQTRTKFEIERVDLKSKITESGADFRAINPKGYVPALVLDGGELVTENVAILDLIALQNPVLGFEGPLGRTRLLEELAFISTEVHKGFKPLFAGGNDRDDADARRVVSQRLAWLAVTREGPFARISVADCYLFVMLVWAKKFEIPVPEVLVMLRGSMMGLPAVRRAMGREGLNVEE